MNKYFVFASMISILAMGLSHFEYIPNYMSIIIALCSFIVAISYSITSVIIGFQNDNKESQEETLKALQKSSDNTIKKIEKMSENVKGIISDNKSHHHEMQKFLKQTETLLIEISGNASQLNENLTSHYDTMIGTLSEKSDLLNTSLVANSTEMAKLDETIKSQMKNVTNDISQFKASIIKTTDDLNNIVKTVTNDLTQQENNILANLSSLNDCIKDYDNSAKLIKDTNCVLSADISKAITDITNSISGLSNKNKRFIDDLKDTMTEHVQNLSDNVRNANKSQTDSLTENETKIRQSVDKLCNNLACNLKKLEIDVDAICESVESMKQLSHAVDKSDKELLEKISRICK